MKKSSAPSQWEHVFVRHTVESRRADTSRLFSLVKVPFESHSSQKYDGRFHQDLSAVSANYSRWLIAAKLPKQSWVPLYSTSEGKDVFEANAASRRLDVVWIGCDPKGIGWFFRLCRATKKTVDFAQGDGSDRMFESTDLKPGFLNRCRSGEKAFQCLCEEFGILLPIPRVRAEGEAFQVLGPRGKPVKKALRGAYVVYGPKLRSKKGSHA